MSSLSFQICPHTAFSVVKSAPWSNYWAAPTKSNSRTKKERPIRLTMGLMRCALQSSDTVARFIDDRVIEVSVSSTPHSVPRIKLSGNVEDQQRADIPRFKTLPHWNQDMKWVRP